MINHRRQRLAGLEPVCRQRGELRLLALPVLPDRARPSGDAAVVVSGLAACDVVVEFRQRLDFGDRGEPGAAEPADLALDTSTGPMADVVDRIVAWVRADERAPASMEETS